MRTFFTFLIIIFLVVFIAQQSHVIEEVKVVDSRWGFTKKDTRVNLDNLFNYFHNIPSEIEKLMKHR